MDAERRRQITLLFQQALAQPPEGRRAFLTSACGDDLALRAELESLLSGNTLDDDCLTVPLAETAADADASSVAGASSGATPGTILGSYQLERLLDRGGMATVFLARDTKHRRTVAIKILNAEIAAAIGTVRFLREIEIAARLVHPHILPLFDSGAVGDQLYYVMPHVQGGSLRARLRSETRLPLDEALRLTRDVASALGHAHAQGFIHCDIKPENILLSDGMALVADFGIARVINARSTETSAITGMAVGTPSYMSPEQALGTEDLGAEADLYSLACVLYEMLAGEPPFKGRNVIAVLTQHVIQGVPPLREKRPDIPDGIEQAIARALAKTPPDRYATAAQFAEALTAGMMGTPLSTPSIRRNAVVSHNLPSQRTSFVGREMELDECAALLRETRLLTLTGIGGCGKTRLALKLAEHLLENYPDGVWFVDLAPLSDGRSVADAVALTLGVRGEMEDGLAETLCRHLKGKRVLLVLDNCEHLLESSRQLVDALLGGGAESRILITSREGLGIEGERLFAVRSLPVPAAESGSDLRAIEGSAAVRLFVDRARIVDAHFTLTQRNAATIADICRRLDGIPLAIELAAARVNVLSVEEIRSKLDDRFRLLTGGKKTLPRHQTLWSVFEWSYDHLMPDEQRLFRLLSVFAGGWTLAAATAVSNEAADEFKVLELLTCLIDKSLVVVERMTSDRVRYRLLETSRQFAQQKLNQAAEAEPARRRHLEYFVQWAEAREALAVGPQRGQWLQEVGWEHQNVLAALDWCDGDAGCAELALRLVAAVWRYWPTRGLSTLGRERLTQALGRGGQESVTPARAKALLGAGRMALRQGALAEARVLLEQSLSFYRRLGDRTGMARALSNVGLACSQEGDHHGARARFEESLALAREAGDRRGASMCLNNLAELCRERGDFKAARPLYEEALGEARVGGDPGNVALCLQNLALLLLQDGDAQGAVRHNLEALHIVRELGLRALGAGIIEATGGLALVAGDLARGIRFGGASQSLFQAMGVKRDPVNEKMRAHFLAPVRAVLGEQGIAQAEAEGAALSYEAALEEVAAWLEAHVAPDVS